MKRIATISVLLLTIHQIFAQCAYSRYEIPAELHRKRLGNNEAGFRYGNPYTMFNRSDYGNWSLNSSLEKIRNRIYSGLDASGNISNGSYADLYRKHLLAANLGEPGK